MVESCYLCGAVEDLTDDHVPPQGFFPTPLPSGLITARCCRRENNRWSKDDEAVRLWASASAEASPAAAWVREHKVRPSFQTRNTKLAEHVRRHHGTQQTFTGAGVIALPFLGIPRERVDGFLIRVTKGLLRHFYPEYVHWGKRFGVLHLDPTRAQDMHRFQELTTNPTNLIEEERGHGVFRFWRRFAHDDQDVGIWVYLFYESCAFVVVHGDPDPGLVLSVRVPCRNGERVKG